MAKSSMRSRPSWHTERIVKEWNFLPSGLDMMKPRTLPGAFSLHYQLTPYPLQVLPRKWASSFIRGRCNSIVDCLLLPLP
jgi:hypothetical protein